MFIAIDQQNSALREAKYEIGESKYERCPPLEGDPFALRSINIGLFGPLRLLAQL
jgi:hypothetical protein